MAKIREEKTWRCEEYAKSIDEKESLLIQQKGELADLLARISRTMEDVNELRVCRREVEESLAEDEARAAQVNREVEENIQQLEIYEYTLEKRKKAIASVGIMEQDVLNHIHSIWKYQQQKAFLLPLNQL